MDVTDTVAEEKMEEVERTYEDHIVYDQSGKPIGVRGKSGPDDSGICLRNAESPKL